MRSDPFVGRYLFHLHTTYTDGTLTVAEYFEWSRCVGVERLIFLEHIRAHPSYDVERFIAEVRHAAVDHGLPALVGFEAKLLPGGALDISPEHLALADVLGVAEHGFPPDFGLWRSSVRTALRQTARAFGERPVIWVHPGLWLKKHGLLGKQERTYRTLLSEAEAQGIRIEWNLRYGLVPEEMRGALAPESLVIGADAHRLVDAEAALAAISAKEPPAST